MFGASRSPGYPATAKDGAVFTPVRPVSIPGDSMRRGTTVWATRSPTTARRQAEALFRTRDGRSWRMLMDDFFPPSGGTEAALAFPKPGLAVCLLRQPSTENGVVDAKLGIGRGPSWQDWEWKALQLDWEGVATFAGPRLLVLKDGRLVATGRNMGLWLVEPETAQLSQIVPPIGNSYPGLVEHDGKLWVTACTPQVDAVVMASFPIPNLALKKSDP